MKSKFFTKTNGSENLVNMIIFFMICVLIYFSFVKYTLFHTIIEIFIVCVGVSIALIAINSYNYYKNSFFIILAISFFFIGLINIMHIISYMQFSCMQFSCNVKVCANRMGVYSHNVSMQLAGAQKYMTIISFIVGNKLLNKNINLVKICFIYIVATILIYISIYLLKIFPICYLVGSGVTMFKRVNDLIVVILAIYSLFLLKRNKRYFKDKIYLRLSLYLILFILYNITYVVLIGRFHIKYSICNIICHYLKFISFCMIYDAFIKVTLKYPYESIFNEINDKADELKRLNEILNIKNIKLRESKLNIRKSKSKYKKVLEWIPDAIIIREEGRIVYANNAFIKMFKFKDKKEVIDKEVFSIFPQKCSAIIRRKMNELKKNQIVPFKQEKLFAVDGEEIDTEVCSISIDLYGKENRVNIIRNFQERKKYERLSLELEEKDNLRIEFFANICHELRTPVNVIYSAVQLQETYLNQKNIELINKYNKIIKHNCYRLLRLCNNLIDMTKIDAGFVQAHMNLYNIVELIENITISVVPYANSKDLQIIFDTDTEEVYMMCDLNFMERIMLNLLSNAIKFSVENGCIWVSIHEYKEEIQISIKDNGIGIAEDKQKVIFERFMQADKSFTRRCEGSGIGLSLVKSFVELQEGKIRCYSTEGKGTEFIIKFPFNKQLHKNNENKENRNLQGCKAESNICVEFSDIYFN